VLLNVAGVARKDAVPLLVDLAGVGQVLEDQLRRLRLPRTRLAADGGGGGRTSSLVSFERLLKTGSDQSDERSCCIHT
jgi:hypothetical protein